MNNLPGAKGPPGTAPHLGLCPKVATNILAISIYKKMMRVWYAASIEWAVEQDWGGHVYYLAQQRDSFIRGGFRKEVTSFLQNAAKQIPADEDVYLALAGLFSGDI